ncbi:MAG: hypothetical protein M1838_006127 [Thelocarpon superellum]|nr:MAG: hypothetical protein M1838_006127 [Thelocarpon superellum]
MRSFEESRTRWQALRADFPTRSALRGAAKLGDGASPCVSGLRSVCWKVEHPPRSSNTARRRLTWYFQAYLLFPDYSPASWVEKQAQTRQAYVDLRTKYLHTLLHPHEIESAVDPLADDEAVGPHAPRTPPSNLTSDQDLKSPWIVLRRDEALRAEIRQDVERCMPEVAYFRAPDTQDVMVDILFIFCKINADVGYRQGMHELLAPILWVVEQDATDAPNPTDEAQADPQLESLLDRRYVEHDAYTLFTIVMRGAISFYELGDHEKAAVGTTGSGPSPTPPAPATSPIVQQSRRIHHVYLAAVDPELAARLTEVDVLPQVFLIRWIRLLFSREFPFVEVLAFWDVLFAEDPTLRLVDLICVAMLLRVRWQLLDADYTGALTLLLRYPSPVAPHGPSTFVQDAMYLRDHLTHAGGHHVIFTYSGKAPVSGTDDVFAAHGEMDPRSLTVDGRLFRERSPLGSPAKYIQQQGGLEALLQGAAKGIYNRGERLGVNRAVREAVTEVKRGLQSAGTSPRRSVDGGRWSLEEGRYVRGRDGEADDKASVQALEARNKELGRMLGEAIDDLWTQQAHGTDGADDHATVSPSDAFNLAVAKVQFVQVYLDDSTLPLPDDERPLTVAAMPARPGRRPSIPADNKTPTARPSTATAPLATVADRPLRLPRPSTITTHTVNAIANTNNASIPSHPGNANVSSTTSIPDEAAVRTAGSPTPKPARAHQARSSLAQSSFAWMLGEDDPRPGAIASFPSPASASKNSRAGSRPGFLFGDNGDDDASKPAGGGHQDEGGFSLGSLKGSKAESDSAP